jgi:hypothetical protein
MAPREPSCETPADLGVLFVHGIGQQAWGDTLVRFGDPLLTWIGHWCVGASAAAWTHLHRKEWFVPERVLADLCVVAKGTSVQEGATSGPAHALVELRLPYLELAPEAGASADAPDGSTSTLDLRTRGDWLLAESCWARAFLTPGFRGLAFWAFVVYPWTSASHYGAQVRRAWALWRKRSGAPQVLTAPLLAVRTAASFAVSVLLALVVLAALALLLVLAIPPIPALRSILLRIQQTLADSVGDSYILLASPIQRAAIISHVRRDLEWLLPRCRRIAVVAHSQGAAVAYEALCTGVLDGRSREDSLFITFGSGLSKLEEIRRIIGTKKRWFGWWPIFGLLTLVVALDLLGAVDVLPFVAGDKVWGGVAAFFGAFIWLIGALESTRRRRFDAGDFTPADHFGVDLTWKDYYASRDPVPNGPLLEEDAPYLESVEVHNIGSVVSDHTSYWLNRDAFVPQVARDLGDFAGAPLVDILPRDRELIVAAAARRCWRVNWLITARMTAWVVLIAIVAAYWSDLGRLGATVIERGGPVARVLGWLGLETPSAEHLARSAIALWLAGALALAATTGVAYLALYGLWRLWTFRDTQLFLERRHDPSESAFWLFAISLLVFVDAGIIAALSRTRTDDFFGWLAGGLAIFLPLFILVVGYRLVRGQPFWSAYGRALLHCAVAVLVLITPIGALTVALPTLIARLATGDSGSPWVHAYMIAVLGLALGAGFAIAARLERGFWCAWPVVPIRQFDD